MRFAGVKRHWLAMAVAALLIGGGLSWSSTAAQACTVTTTVAKPTGLTATLLTPDTGWNQNGIRLEWDVADEADKVYKYEIWRGEEGGTLAYHADIEIAGVYNVATRTYMYPASPPMDIFDPESADLEDGKTYTYRVVAARWDNCGDYQTSEPSDQVSATFRRP